MQPSLADQSAAVAGMALDWELARALLGGTRSMREAGETYLPRWPNEDQAAYDCRRETAVLFPAYARTVLTLAGKPFSKPVTLGEDIPPRIVEWLDDADLQGRNLDGIASDLMECALGYGIAGLLIEYPKADGVRTLADERSAGLRPYFVEVKPWQVLGWMAARVNGAWALQQLRIMESVEEPDGAFAVKSVDQVRLLEPGKWSTFRQNEKKDWILFADGVTSLSYIPYVPIYGQRTGYMTGKPPLIEVAHLNVAHWQAASDQQTILHVARVPILTVIGVDDDKWTMTVGASSAVKLPLGGDMKFVEHSGAAITAGATDLAALEERMRQAGAELLVIDQKITATQVATENAVGMCALLRIAQGVEGALDQALQIMAEWVGEKEGGKVTLFSDYGAATLQEASAQLLLSANMAGKLSDETLHSELQRRGILSADVDWDAERDRIDGQGPALGRVGDDGDDGEDQMTATEPGAPKGPKRPDASGASATPEVDPQQPVADFGPLTDAIRALAEKPGPEPIDWAPLIDALKSQPVPQLEMDVTPIADAIRELQNMPAPVVNIPAQPSHIFNIDASTAIPEQPATIVNVAQPAITIEPPTVNVAAPTVNVAPADVTVNVAKSGNKSGTLTKKADGSYSMEVQEQSGLPR